MTPEQKEYYEKELVKIRRGGYLHDACMLNYVFGMGSENLGPIEQPVVAFGQDGDPYYTQYFQNWGEVNALIDNLKAEAEKAWGKETK